MQTLWILADQLSLENAALAGADPASSVVLLIESKARGEVVVYHQQKLVLVYSGMRHFARDLRAAGWRVDYHSLEDTPDFLTGLHRHVGRYQPAETCLRRSILPWHPARSSSATSPTFLPGRVGSTWRSSSISSAARSSAGVWPTPCTPPRHHGPPACHR